MQQLGLTFELKGGTSLSKGFQIINRFSEDIDIRIEPPKDRDVKTGRNHDKPAHIQSRRDFYDWLAKTIRINGIEKVERDTAFDNKTLMSAGIRLFYKTHTKALDGLKSGVLLELGFDDVTPNSQEGHQLVALRLRGRQGDIIDNRAKGVACYDPGYTFVEKLQTVSTKFRHQQAKQEYSDRFHATLLRCLRPAETARSAGIHRHGGLSRRTRRSAFVAATIPTSQKTKPSFSPIRKPAKPTRRLSPTAPRFTTATNRRSTKFSKTSLSGEIAYRDAEDEKARERLPFVTASERAQWK